MTELLGGDSSPPELARAEELLDATLRQVSAWSSRIGREILKEVALAREEAEDIWAEAQVASRGHVE